MGRGSRSGGAAAVVVAVAVLVLGVVAVPRLLGRDDGPRASVRLPPGTPVFAADELTWAQDSTIHYGDRRFDVSPWLVRSMLRTDYGLLLEGARRRGPYAPTRTLWYDGTTLTELPGEVHSAKVSPDGRYLGWIDLRGPDLGHGNVGEAVVVDLRRGTELVRDHRGMSDGSGVDVAEQYAEGGPDFLGFDHDAGYWRDVVGAGHRWRLDLASGEVADLGEPTEQDPFGPRLGDSVRGWDAHRRDVQPAEAAVRAGFLSPNLRWYFDTASTGALPVHDERSGREVTPDYGYRWVFFGGWRSPNTFYVLARRHYGFAVAPRPDGSRGVLVSCRVPTGKCREVARVRDTNTLVFGTGGSVLDGL